MANTCDILIFGTGSFAQRIACDLAATAAAPTRLTIAGRNGLRLDWIATAARARAHMFARPVEVTSRRIDLAAPDAAVAIQSRRSPLRPAMLSRVGAAAVAARSHAMRCAKLPVPKMRMSQVLAMVYWLRSTADLTTKFPPCQRPGPGHPPSSAVPMLAAAARASR